MGKAIRDLKGQRFGRLTVLSYTYKNYHGSAVWRCSCDCGKIVEVCSRSLTKGLTRSCGCYRSDFSSKDLTNMKFGKLIVINKVKSEAENSFTGNMWECKCDCGNTTIVQSHNLLSENTKSCGCLGIKKGKANLKNQKE